MNELARNAMRAEVRISAGHHWGNEWCGQAPHGHRYRIIATWEREGFPATDHTEWARLRQVLLDLALELKDRDLGKMLGPQVPNVFGVASFFMERLTILSPILSVEVHEDEGPIAVIERVGDR